MHKPFAKDKLKIEKRGTCLEVVNRAPHASTGWIIVQIEGRKLAYHRHVWEQANGPLEPKQVVRQTCGNRRCCNLKHLSLGQHGADIEFMISEGGCHVCTSHKQGFHGYPQGRDKIHSSGTTENLHAIVWKRHYGPIATGLLVRHKCDNRMCVNPDHLELGTTAENSEDMVGRGRQSRGSKSAKAKLTEDNVREIRKQLAEGVFQKDIAKQFGVAQTKISAIKIGQTWKHVA